MTKWTAIKDALPDKGQSVLLANNERMRAFDPEGCVKDVGVLWDFDGANKHWCTQGSRRALTLDAFTHWSPISDPLPPTEERFASIIDDALNRLTNSP